MKISVDKHDIRLGDIVSHEYASCDLGIVGIPFDGSTRGRPGARFAPECIRRELYSMVPVVSGREIDGKIVDFGDAETFYGSVTENFEEIERKVLEATKYSKRLLIIGGDHSITYPTTKAVSKEWGKFGLIVFDAHLDLRELKSGRVSSGTVMGDIVSSLKEKFDPRNLVYIGIRDFVNPKYYIEKARSLGAKIFFAHEIWDWDESLVKEAYQRASDGVDFVYVSFDADSVEARYLPGLNAPVPLGLDPRFVARAIRMLRDLGARVLDVTEVAPAYDPSGLTCRIVASIIAHFL